MSKALAQTNQQIDENMLLGYVFFYSIGELKLTENELTDTFNNNNLDTKYIRKISPIDAFRRASSALKRSIDINYNGGVAKCKIEVDEVSCDTNEIIRKVGRKVINGSNKTVSYQSVGEINYDKNTNSVGLYTDSSYANEFDYSALIQECEDKFQEWSVYHTKETVRNMCVQILKDMYPINLMPTGLCKFVPKSNKDLMFSLRDTIRELSNYGDPCLFEVIPVIDTDEQRDLIDRSATSEIKQELNDFMLELHETLKTKNSLPTRSVNAYLEKFNDLKNKVSEYEGLLGSYMNMIRQQIEISMQLVEDNRE